MAKPKSQPHPRTGNRGTRDQRFFPGLSGLGSAIGALIDSAPRAAGPTVGSREERQAKHAAKLARRAKAAGHQV